MVNSIKIILKPFCGRNHTFIYDFRVEDMAVNVRVVLTDGACGSA